METGSCDFYVYVHRKISDGTIFYVGKGRGDRLYKKSGRSKHWLNTASKHGFYWQLVECDLSESDAFIKERILISKLGRSRLTNGTDGGEGWSGGEWNENHRAALEIPLRNCSGETFRSASEAARYLKLNGYSRASQGCISAAARGVKKSAYGRVWWEDGGIAKQPYSASRQHRNVPVLRSDGRHFISLYEAVEELRREGFEKASHPHISSCCRGKRKSYCSYGWSYKEEKND